MGFMFFGCTILSLTRRYHLSTQHIRDCKSGDLVVGHHSRPVHFNLELTSTLIV